MKRKEITIDDLARIVQGEFTAVQRKLDRLDKNMTRLATNDQTILKRLEGVVYRTEFEKLEIRVKELENLQTNDQLH